MSSCGSSNSTDFDDSTVRLVCTNCGHAVNDSFIVSGISSGETSSGAARVQGSYVAEGKLMLVGVVGEGLRVGIVLGAGNR